MFKPSYLTGGGDAGVIANFHIVESPFGANKAPFANFTVAEHVVISNLQSNVYVIAS